MTATSTRPIIRVRPPNAPDYKQCPDCRREGIPPLPWHLFPTRRNRHDGLYGYCYQHKYKRYKKHHMASAQNYRARKAAAWGIVTPADWLLLRHLHKLTCQRCGATEGLSFDHVIPLSAGGDNDIFNGQILCMPCNLHKGTAPSDYRKIPLIRLSLVTP